jgi:hypothetical protein
MFNSRILPTLLAAGFAFLALHSQACAQVNLALGKTAVVSSTQAGTASNVLDGSLTTRWGSLYTDNEWIYVDLGSSVPVAQVTLRWQSAYGSSYIIQTSTNGTTWDDRATLTAQNGGTDDIFFPTASARYVKMQGLTRGTGWGYSLYEFEIYAPVAAADITGPTSFTGVVGIPLSVQIIATNASSYSATFLPAGLSVNTATGLISGTPTAVSQGLATLSAIGPSGSDSLSCTYTITNGAPVITGPSSITGTVGIAFSAQITATNNPTSYAISGSIPPGLSLNHTTGLISGVPTGSGSGTLIISASNVTGGGTATIPFTISPPLAGNLALNKMVSASSFQAGNETVKGNDGSGTTRWAAGTGSFPQTWTVDLGASYNLTHIDIDWLNPTSRAYKYKLEGSADGSNFNVLLKDNTGNTTIGNTVDNVTGSARHVRVTVTGSTTGGFASFFECRVYGTSGPSIRIVNADAKVQSRKRGVGMNALSADDFQALAPGVSWYYNWGNNPGSYVPPAGTAMTFYPMVWGNGAGDLNGAATYLASANPKPPVILGINEPNLRGQAFITPQATANSYAQIQNLGNQYNIPVIAPNMAIGSGAADSIVANDPYLGNNYTYTYMEPFLNAFLFYANQLNAPVPAVSFHSYGNLGELKYFVGQMASVYGRPVWVTEFSFWNAANATEARDYLIQAADFLERSPDVAGYAWFKERSTENTANISLLVPGQSGVLTPLGQNYVALPPHASDLYYRLPGRLPAENYVVTNGGDLRATTDTGGTFDLTLSGTSSADYNVQVDSARNYTVQFRVVGAGTIVLSKGGTTLATVTTTATGWQTVSASIPLAAGAQTLRITRTGSVSAVNWIEFQ